MTTHKITQIAAAALVGFVLTVAPVQAQENWMGVSWGAAFPLSDTKDFAQGTSFRNVAFDYSRFIERHIAVGFTAAWSVFSERYDGVTTSFEGIDLHGTQVRYVNAFPLLITGRYFVIGRESRDKPNFWIGGGAGTVIGANRVDFGQFSFKETNWHLAIAPEAGVSFAFRRDLAMFGQARYTHAFKTNGIQHQFWNFNVGLAWRN